MHPGTDLFARLAMLLTQIRKKAFQIFTPNYLPSLFHTHHSGARLDNPNLTVVFSYRSGGRFAGKCCFCNWVGVQGCAVIGSS